MSAAATAREQQIADLYDDGVNNKEIAKRLGLSRRYVRLIVWRLGLTDDGSDRRYRTSMELSSEALLHALQREGFA